MTVDQPEQGYTECICCRQPFSEENVFTKEGALETQISGMCEVCFDSLFEDMEGIGD